MLPEWFQTFEFVTLNFSRVFRETFLETSSKAV